MSDTPITANLVFTKETPGTYVFTNTDPAATITTIYVKKAAFGAAGAPQRARLMFQPVK